jgi:hypothetical protein
MAQHPPITEEQHVHSHWIAIAQTIQSVPLDHAIHDSLL